MLATAAAPFLQKLVQGAKGNIAFGVGLMVLLMVVTVVYMPLVLPLVLPGVSVNPVGHRQVADRAHAHPAEARLLLFKSHSPNDAAQWQPVMNTIPVWPFLSCW